MTQGRILSEELEAFGSRIGCKKRDKMEFRLNAAMSNRPQPNSGPGIHEFRCLIDIRGKSITELKVGSRETCFCVGFCPRGTQMLLSFRGTECLCAFGAQCTECRVAKATGLGGTKTNHRVKFWKDGKFYTFPNF